MVLLSWPHQGLDLVIAETIEGLWGEYRERAQVQA